MFPAKDKEDNTVERQSTLLVKERKSGFGICGRRGICTEGGGGVSRRKGRVRYGPRMRMMRICGWKEDDDEDEGGRNENAAAVAAAATTGKERKEKKKKSENKAVAVRLIRLVMDGAPAASWGERQDGSGQLITL